MQEYKYFIYKRDILGDNFYEISVFILLVSASSNVR